MTMTALSIKMIIFFFSSRRRHTILQGDWSSTCALPICGPPFGRRTHRIRLPRRGPDPQRESVECRRWMRGDPRTDIGRHLRDPVDGGEAALEPQQVRKSVVKGKRAEPGGRSVLKKKHEA